MEESAVKVSESAFLLEGVQGGSERVDTEEVVLKVCEHGGGKPTEQARWLKRDARRPRHCFCEGDGFLECELGKSKVSE